MPAASWQMAARALPRAGAVSLLGTMLAAVDYLNVPFLSGSAQFHAKRPQPVTRLGPFSLWPVMRGRQLRRP